MSAIDLHGWRPMAQAPKDEHYIVLRMWGTKPEVVHAHCEGTVGALAWMPLPPVPLNWREIGEHFEADGEKGQP